MNLYIIPELLPYIIFELFSRIFPGNFRKQAQNIQESRSNCCVLLTPISFSYLELVTREVIIVDETYSIVRASETEIKFIVTLQARARDDKALWVQARRSDNPLSQIKHTQHNRVLIYSLHEQVLIPLLKTNAQVLHKSADAGTHLPVSRLT